MLEKLIRENSNSRAISHIEDLWGNWRTPELRGILRVAVEKLDAKSQLHEARLSRCLSGRNVRFFTISDLKTLQVVTLLEEFEV